MPVRIEPVEANEYDLPPLEVPATLDGVTYELTDLSRQGQGEIYIACDIRNGAAVKVYLVDANGRRYPVASGGSAVFDLDPGVTWLGVLPSGGNIAAGEVSLIPTVRSPLRG